MELGKAKNWVGWKPTEEMTEQMNQAITKAIKYAQNHLIPKGYNGAYFSRENGLLTDWVVGEPERGNGLIFIHYTDFKYRGSVGEYVTHLEHLVNHLSEKREAPAAEKLLLEAYRELVIDDDNHLDRHCEWFRDVDLYVKNKVEENADSE